MARVHWFRIVACVFGLVACSGADEPTDSAASNEEEIVRGHSDRGADRAVVAIDIEGIGLCSGTLIRSDIVLTARHCVSHTRPEVICPSKSSQLGAARAPEDLVILVGNDTKSARRRARGREVVVPSGNTLCNADIALIVLDHKIDDVTPIKVSTRAIGRDDRIRAVGFGLTGDDGQAGSKRVREHVRVLETTSHEFAVAESTCQGDSGGPALDEATNEVVGVVSRGGPTCEGPDVRNIYTRIDAFRSLIATALARSRGAAATR